MPRPKGSKNKKTLAKQAEAKKKVINNIPNEKIEKEKTEVATQKTDVSFAQAFSAVVEEMHPTDTNPNMAVERATTAQPTITENRPKSVFSEIENLIPKFQRETDKPTSRKVVEEQSKNEKLPEAEIGREIDPDNLNYNRTQRIVVELGHIRSRQIDLYYPIKYENKNKVLIVVLGTHYKFTSANNDFQIKHMDNYASIVWEENTPFAYALLNKSKLLVKYIS